MITTLLLALVTALPEQEALRPASAPPVMVKKTRPVVLATAPVPGHTAAGVLRALAPREPAPVVGAMATAWPVVAEPLLRVLDPDRVMSKYLA
ncbi:MAG TPA: hypothetical protein VIR33_04005, partial [Thermopolyspora sp.]